MKEADVRVMYRGFWMLIFFPFLSMCLLPVFIPDVKYKGSCYDLEQGRFLNGLHPLHKLNGLHTFPLSLPAK